VVAGVAAGVVVSSAAAAFKACCRFLLASFAEGSADSPFVFRARVDPVVFLGDALLLGDADRRGRPRLGVGAASDSVGMKKTGGGEIDFGVASFVGLTWIGSGSNSASIQGRILYSAASTSACCGGIHTLPAVSSELVVSSFLMYFRSISSSAASAYGKVALNIPVALIYPSSLRRIRKYDAGEGLNIPETMPLGSGARRCA
jgi:hypothetical protein